MCLFNGISSLFINRIPSEGFFFFFFLLIWIPLVRNSQNFQVYNLKNPDLGVSWRQFAYNPLINSFEWEQRLGFNDIYTIVSAFRFCFHSVVGPKRSLFWPFLLLIRYFFNRGRLFFGGAPPPGGWAITGKKSSWLDCFVSIKFGNCFSAI